MKIAFKFKVNRLKGVCCEKLCNSLTKENVVENFIAGSEVEEPYLVSNSLYPSTYQKFQKLNNISGKNSHKILDRKQHQNGQDKV